MTPEQREQMSIDSITRLIEMDHAESLRRWYALAGEPRRSAAERQRIQHYIDSLTAITLPGAPQSEAA
ncbi:hypothetical protein [Streptomyces harbinensis]|uniref:Uncharacterized protein n=2 Tax=Streptomyces TaxID=1883 RepID=A0A1I6RS78_9ACTN|nr:hypothetical protein [Streptomyces harbinensis]SFS67318.1 hypothetical protein SAMN05444716_103315 [Streptomyces harbinensis]